ncbi:hypothetical protein MSZK_33680 [Mycobacterium sp. shizuoka-1]|nr:hypothetical protein MSZK_33680 [Mycobacterium sp. shizuoka-1]
MSESKKVRSRLTTPIDATKATTITAATQNRFSKPDIGGISLSCERIRTAARGFVHSVIP